MRAEAKRSSAANRDGSATRGSVFGRILAATRASSLSADGSGAPTHRGRLTLLALATVALTFALAVGIASAREVFTYFGTETGTGTLGGQFNNPRDVAVNTTGAGPADAGDIYVVDDSNHRIQRFDEDYNFISAWGANVTGRDEVQQITFTGVTAGTYRLSFDPDGGGPQPSEVTANINFNATGPNIATALALLPSIGSGNVSGSGAAAATVKTITFRGALAGTNVTELTADTTGLTGSLSIQTIENGSGGPGSDYEVCAVAASCGPAIETGGNGAVAGNGALANPQSVAVDNDTGLVYVADRDNRRINVYDGAGAFRFSVGRDVQDPDGGATVEICGDVVGDVCRQADTGAGPGEIGSNANNGIMGIVVSPPDSNAATGTVFLADTQNRRVNTYNLDGTSPSSFGSLANFGSSQPRRVAVDSRGIVYASDSNANQEIDRYDTLNANGGGVGFLPSLAGHVNEVQSLTISATAGQFKLSFDPDGGGPLPSETTADLAFNANASSGTTSATVRGQLRGLPSIGAAGVDVTGGPGGTSPYTITFDGALAGKDVAQLVVSDGTTPLSGGSGGSVTTTTNGRTDALLPGASSVGTSGLAVDPDSDGVGPDEDVLYVLRDRLTGNTAMQQIGPANDPGLTAAPIAFDALHGAPAGFDAVNGLGLNDAEGRLFVTANHGGGHRAFVLEDFPAAAVSIDSLSEVTPTSATVNGTINPGGAPVVSYHLEYSDDGGATWQRPPGASGADTLLGSQTSGQPVSLPFSLPPFGLRPGTSYSLRLVATRVFNADVFDTDSFTTPLAKPTVETNGAPIRTTTTAQLNGRVNPRNSVTSFHFEYGLTDSYGQSTASVSAGSGGVDRLVAAEIDGLEPNTTYHYRVVADNAAVGPPVLGEDMTVTTHASDAPLSHGDFPGPIGSDRAWEQVSVPDSSGNPVFPGASFSADGTRVHYKLGGGTDSSGTGGAGTDFFAERTESGWQERNIWPTREELVGKGNLLGFEVTTPANDLRSIVFMDSEPVADVWAYFRSSLDGEPEKLVTTTQAAIHTRWVVVADGSSRAIARLEGDFDPNFPTAAGVLNFYDIDSEPPRLVSVLPDDSPMVCDTDESSSSQSINWLSTDGSLFYFEGEDAAACSGGGTRDLFLRDLDAGVTRRVSPNPVSGLDCDAGLIRALPGEAFFWTKSRLAAEDTGPTDCSDSSADGDVYRYDLSDDGLTCVTCVVPGLDADVTITTSGVASTASTNRAPSDIAVADDGSRIYFRSPTGLLPGADVGGNSVYRVDVSTGELRWIGLNVIVGQIGEMTPDGSTFTFSSAHESRNPIGGDGNGGTSQVYRYNDNDGSIECVSCPLEGDATVSASGGGMTVDGKTVVFQTAAPLVSFDQNTATTGQGSSVGLDIYEWRDGRHLLVTDGVTERGPGAEPNVGGITPGGQDVFFTLADQLTPDALDGYRRLYTARIGGGVVFPEASTPCPLEVCQGTPRGRPDLRNAATEGFQGAGNVKTTAQRRKPQRCGKGKRKVRRGGKVRCVKRGKKGANAKKRQANHDRRNAR